MQRAGNHHIERMEFRTRSTDLPETVTDMKFLLAISNFTFYLWSWRHPKLICRVRLGFLRNGESGGDCASVPPMEWVFGVTASCSGYHWATGRRGLSSISNQWSLPVPVHPAPAKTQPNSSFGPTLKFQVGTKVVRVVSGVDPVFPVKSYLICNLN